MLDDSVGALGDSAVGSWSSAIERRVLHQTDRGGKLGRATAIGFFESAYIVATPVNHRAADQELFAIGYRGRIEVCRAVNRLRFGFLAFALAGLAIATGSASLSDRIPKSGDFGRLRVGDSYHCDGSKVEPPAV